MKDAGSLAPPGTRWGLGQETLRGGGGGTDSLKLINDVLYLMRVGLPRAPAQVGWGGGLQGSGAGVASGRVKVVCLELLLKSHRKAGFYRMVPSTSEPTSRGQQTDSASVSD